MANILRGLRSAFRRTPQIVPTNARLDDPIGQGDVLAFELNPGWDSITPIRSRAHKSSSDSELIDGGLWTLRINADTAGLANAYIASVWAHRCVEARAWAVGRMPYKVVHKKTRVAIESHPMFRAMQRRRDLMRRIEWSLCIWGEAFIEKQFNRLNYPAGLGWLNPMGMDVDTSIGRIRQFRYTSVNGGEYVNFTPDEIVFIKTDNPYDDLRGLAPLITVLNEVRVDRDVSRMMQAFYANDARPGILLVPKEPLSEADMDRFITFWKATFGSPRNAGKPALVPYELDVREVQRAPTQDDTGIRESMRREICAAFGVPLSYAGAWDSSTYQSSPEQRRAFYEDTIIPQCEIIADALNQHAMPFFDPSGDYELEFDYSEVLALSELRANQEQVYKDRWQQGLMTLNEVREAIGATKLAGGDVLLIGGNMIPLDQIGKVAESATDAIIRTAENAADAQNSPTPDASPPKLDVGKPPDIPDPKLPKSLEAEEAQTPIKPIAIQKPHPPQKPLREEEAQKPDAKSVLRAWERKAIRRGANASFSTDVLHPDTVRHIRTRLNAVSGVTDANLRRSAIQGIFAGVRAGLTEGLPVTDTLDTPSAEQNSASSEEAAAYWEGYDKLQEQVGEIWMGDYQAKIWQELSKVLKHGAVTEADVINAMANMEDDLVDAWVGDEDKPGVFAQLVLAGAAAADAALGGDNPTPSSAKSERTRISWTLMDKDAKQWARQQAGRAIRNINRTTLDTVRKTIADWIQSGKPLGTLRRNLRRVFFDPVRAERIAQTESTAAYHAGAEARYATANIEYLRFQTVRDAVVCPTCAPLHNTIAARSTGWTGINGNPKPPIHVGCRCFVRPVTESELKANKWKKWTG